MILIVLNWIELVTNVDYVFIHCLVDSISRSRFQTCQQRSTSVQRIWSQPSPRGRTWRGSRAATDKVPQTGCFHYKKAEIKHKVSRRLSDSNGKIQKNGDFTMRLMRLSFLPNFSEKEIRKPMDMSRAIQVVWKFKQFGSTCRG